MKKLLEDNTTIELLRDDGIMILHTIGGGEG